MWTMIWVNTDYIPGFYGLLARSLDRTVSYTLLELKAFDRT